MAGDQVVRDGVGIGIGVRTVAVPRPIDVDGTEVIGEGTAVDPGAGLTRGGGIEEIGARGVVPGAVAAAGNAG